MNDPASLPKRRGRPKGPRPALTSAQKMRRARERVQEALNAPEGEVARLPDSLLLEALCAAYRAQRRGDVAGRSRTARPAQHRHAAAQYRHRDRKPRQSRTSAAVRHPPSRAQQLDRPGRSATARGAHRHRRSGG
ncbi:MAG: hypothetical protein MZV65_43045 [Chromatiales bacterium]|nr:hypothetical protein [Chromatiales bacterium]